MYELFYMSRMDIHKFTIKVKMIIKCDVIITEERISHIKERHPYDFEKYCDYLRKIVEEPDYIIQSNKSNTALI